MQSLFNFDNSYARLPERFYARVKPEPAANPLIGRVNCSLAQELGIDCAQLMSDQSGALFTGTIVPQGAEPIAQVYAGHQFGHFVPSLGDGRAILLGEHLAPDGRRYDLQLKGSGRTPFSRRGDGRAALGPVIREFIIGEALHTLRIPATRSLGFATTGEEVYRERALPGAVLMRVAKSHIRVGTFEYFAARNDREALQILADYVLARHYPECEGRSNRYEEMCVQFIARQAALVAGWMGVGFIHGVMNTDNVALSGESIDFGPCAFMDTYDADTVFSSIDTEGRYSFGAQPGITQWNVARFLEAVLPLLHTDQDSALAKAKEILDTFPGVFRERWLHVMRQKLGLNSHEPQDLELIQDLLETLQTEQLDYTQAFRELCFESSPEKGIFTQQRLCDWYRKWCERISPERNARGTQESLAAMQGVNPAYIPRNHRVEEVITAAVDRGDLAPLDTLMQVLKAPYVETLFAGGFEAPAPPSFAGYRTFCGT